MTLSLRVGNQSAFSVGPMVPFEFALKHGFDAFEWFPDRRPDGGGWGCADIGAPARGEIRKKARDAGVRLSVHAPIPADPLRPHTHGDFDEALGLAVDLGAAVVNVHLTEPNRSEEFAERLRPWVGRCEAAGVKLAVENIPATGPDDFNRLFAALPASTSVGVCLDIGHANIHHSTRNDYLGWLDRLRADVPIIHLHMHENHGDRDAHLVLFTGPASANDAGPRGLVARLARRGFDGSAVLEQWPSPPEMLVAARDRILALAKEVKP